MMAAPEAAGRTIVIDYGPDAKGWTGRRGLADVPEATGR